MDVTGEEFEMLMSVVSQLSYISTPPGVQELVTIISDQADLSSLFKVSAKSALLIFLLSPPPPPLPVHVCMNVQAQCSV